MFQPTQIGALVIYHNRVDSAFQIFCTKQLTTEASINPLNELYTKDIEVSWLEHRGHGNVIAEINLPSTDYWYNYALNHNAVQEYMHKNCADLNALDAYEQRLHWIYFGHRQYLIEAMGVDSFYQSITTEELERKYGK